MNRFISIILITIFSSLILSGCARDLSSDVYTSDSTMSFTMEGVIIAVRKVKIKEGDRLSDNSTGALAGGALGGVTGSTLGSNRNDSAVAGVGGAIVGGLAGAAIQGALGTSSGYEYIIKVDQSKIGDNYYSGSAAMRNAIASAKASGLMTILQGTDVVFGENQPVYVIVSEKRTRIIAR